MGYAPTLTSQVSVHLEKRKIHLNSYRRWGQNRVLDIKHLARYKPFAFATCQLEADCRGEAILVAVSPEDSTQGGQPSLQSYA